MPRSLESIERDCLGCQSCALGQTRTKLVFGAGNSQARVVFIGEAPGKNEDEQGEPFVGAAGKKLSAMLELAGLTRDDIYIANILKCRPPKNRNPLAAEVEACTPWLREQLTSISPQVLVTLGNFATRFILQTSEGITQLRGHVHECAPYQVLPMFHPAAVIYDRTKAAILESDFEFLGELLKKEP